MHFVLVYLVEATLTPPRHRPLRFHGLVFELSLLFVQRLLVVSVTLVEATLALPRHHHLRFHGLGFEFSFAVRPETLNRPGIFGGGNSNSSSSSSSPSFSWACFRVLIAVRPRTLDRTG